jgi:hypothetical protein
MQPIEVFFENVRRSAIVLKPKQPFKDWLISMDPAEKNYELAKESDIYLLPDFEYDKQVENWLKKNFDQIFCDQMNNWYMDETVWVKNRTFKLFKDWFDYSIHTMIWDTMDEPIDKH